MMTPRLDAEYVQTSVVDAVSRRGRETVPDIIPITILFYPYTVWFISILRTQKWLKMFTCRYASYFFFSIVLVNIRLKIMKYKQLGR